MTKIIAPVSIRPFVDESGLLTEEQRVYFDTLANRIPQFGNGSPENKVSANLGATYYDLDAPQGSRTYLKLQDAIDGDDKRGWQLA